MPYVDTVRGTKSHTIKTILHKACFPHTVAVFNRVDTDLGKVTHIYATDVPEDECVDVSLALNKILANHDQEIGDYTAGAYDHDDSHRIP